jgi:hypothetical protein
MMSSGALPKVALSSPPIASPVRVASFSVACTIVDAIGTMATPAEKKITRGRRVYQFFQHHRYRHENQQPVHRAAKELAHRRRHWH